MSRLPSLFATIGLVFTMTPGLGAATPATANTPLQLAEARPAPLRTPMALPAQGPKATAGETTRKGAVPQRTASGEIRWVSPGKKVAATPSAAAKSAAAKARAAAERAALAKRVAQTLLKEQTLPPGSALQRRHPVVAAARKAATTSAHRRAARHRYARLSHARHNRGSQAKRLVKRTVEPPIPMFIGDLYVQAPAPLWAAPRTGTLLAQLPRATIVTNMGRYGSFYKVEAPNGSVGYVSARLLGHSMPSW